MKIDITGIITAHWLTLRDVEQNRTAYADIVLFYGLPVAAAAAVYFANLKVKPDHYNASITFFGIFLALLLNIQVAIFSIFQRKWERPSDPHESDLQKRELADRQRLLGELNTNIAYLTVFSSVSLALFIVFYVFGWETGIAPAIATFIYCHFLLTFVMVVKRAHALFQKEYRDGATSA